MSVISYVVVILDFDATIVIFDAVNTFYKTLMLVLFLALSINLQTINNPSTNTSGDYLIKN